MLSLIGWINGIIAIFIIVLTITFGSWFLYKSIKLRAKLLFYESIMIIIGWLGFFILTFLDFFTVLLTGENIVTSNAAIRILPYIWLAPAAFPVYIVGVEIIIPPEKKTLKWIILSLAVILWSFFYLFLFLDPMGSINYIYPEILGEELIEEIIVFGTPFSIFGVLVLLFYQCFCGFGFLHKSYQSKGVIRKKFALMTIGIFLFNSCSLLMAFISLSPAIVFVRIGFLVSVFCWFFALREESAVSKKLKPKKKVKIESSLFRLTERPDSISEEEVSFHKEKKICLVCKGAVSKLLYMCSECDVLYCVNCFNALSNAENVCWVCDTVLDESKPSKPFKETEKENDLEILEKDTKKPKLPK